MKDHRLIDERSLAFHRRIAGRLASDPGVVEKAKANIARWLETASPGLRPVLLEWRQVLDASTREILTVLEGRDEHSTRLRQSSPFCGILSAGERLEIIREFERRESTAA